ncbi:MAG: hypothetical protein HKP59_04330 [Lutibacter sp.]|uniref:hypothetical protein n=1 Tax=Lutibacter sp. TaxID=1925666 RepID=UPI0017D92068|nr:hypothetical protein [Lutibacter sp.]MBT8316829.1 hypothetical protein [Lutibacter sp.]NNJ57689.1 hypothetical protein [Lutibacter sp.]
MNHREFTAILQNPESIDALKTQQLEEIITEFPYFQSARAIWLKGLNKTKSYKYNSALKKTAAYTINRKVLFDFITSPTFAKNVVTKPEVLENIKPSKEENVKELHQKISQSVTTKQEENKPTEISKEEISITSQHASETLELGTPIKFSSLEPHSFNEWMQLISKKPIIREAKSNDKSTIIDTFIEKNPKIKQLDKTAINADISSESLKENDSLMTETLAKVYLEQKKYENAIKAYHILSLKYPEKSGFFADRIKAIKILQKNKS